MHNNREMRLSRALSKYLIIESITLNNFALIFKINTYLFLIVSIIH